MNILEVKDLSKKFNNFIAVDNISFSLKEGEILGFLGPNGAGKTTTIQMLLGILNPTKGNIYYFGKDLMKERKTIMEQVNFSSTYIELPWYLTVIECLTFVSFLYKIKNRKERLHKVIEIFKLDKILREEFGNLSAGQKTRVSLAKAFLNFPKILLLDEPTASLDPEVAQYVREFLLEEQKKFHVSLVLTSHNMAEVEEVCNRVIFINKGKIIANDTPQNLTKTIQICHIELLIPSNMILAIEYCIKKRIPHKVEGDFISIDIKEKNIALLLKDLTDRGIHYQEISIEKPTLEDYFLQVMGTSNKNMEQII